MSNRFRKRKRNHRLCNIILDLDSSHHLDLNSSYMHHLSSLSNRYLYPSYCYDDIDDYGYDVDDYNIYSSHLYYGNDYDDYGDEYDGYDSLYSSKSSDNNNNSDDENNTYYDAILNRERMISYYCDYTNPYDVTTFHTLYDFITYCDSSGIEVSNEEVLNLIDCDVIHCSTNPLSYYRDGKLELVSDCTYEDLRFTCSDLEDVYEKSIKVKK